MLIAEKYMQVEGEEIEVVYEGVVLEATPREVTIVFNEIAICDFQEGDTVSLQDLSKFILNYYFKLIINYLENRASFLVKNFFL